MRQRASARVCQAGFGMRQLLAMLTLLVVELMLGLVSVVLLVVQLRPSCAFAVGLPPSAGGFTSRSPRSARAP